jgi:hypothetical protein
MRPALNRQEGEGTNIDPREGHVRRADHQQQDEGGRQIMISQNEMLFMRGNAMSGAPIMIGTIQLAKPPISAGMTMKKIMIRP